MAMCATCAHTKASHPEEGPCGETWVVDDGKREVRCRCSEYWATRRDLEDGLPVTAREISFSGGTGRGLNRRITAEFWDGLRQGRGMTVLLRASVVGKKFREKDYGLTETRQLRVDAVFFVPAAEVGEPSRAFDSFGNEVDPETGEILGGGIHELQRERDRGDMEPDGRGHRRVLREVGCEAGLAGEADA